MWTFSAVSLLVAGLAGSSLADLAVPSTPSLSEGRFVISGWGVSYVGESRKRVEVPVNLISEYVHGDRPELTRREIHKLGGALKAHAEMRCGHSVSMTMSLERREKHGRVSHRIMVLIDCDEKGKGDSSELAIR